MKIRCGSLIMKQRPQTLSFSLDTRSPPTPPPPPPPKVCSLLTRHMEQTLRRARMFLCKCVLLLVPELMTIPMLFIASFLDRRHSFLDKRDVSAFKVKDSRRILFNASSRRRHQWHCRTFLLRRVCRQWRLRHLRTGCLNADGAAVAVRKRRKL